MQLVLSHIIICCYFFQDPKSLKPWQNNVCWYVDWKLIKIFRRLSFFQRLSPYCFVRALMKNIRKYKTKFKLFSHFIIYCKLFFQDPKSLTAGLPANLVSLMSKGGLGATKLTEVSKTPKIDNETPAQKQAAAKLALRKQLEKTLLQVRTLSIPENRHLSTV